MHSGYEVVPIYPRGGTIHGMATYPDLRSAAARALRAARSRWSTSSAASASRRPHVEEAIEIGAKAVWMQLDVWNQEAAERAACRGALVVMDRCPAIDYPRPDRPGDRTRFRPG